MTTPPTFKDERQSERDLIQRMRRFNLAITEMSKKAVGEMSTASIEKVLESFSMLLSGEYGDQETLEMPIDVVRQTSLFALVSLSRLLGERYKLEKKLGRPVVVEAEVVEPTAEELVGEEVVAAIGEIDPDKVPTPEQQAGIDAAGEILKKMHAAAVKPE
jgi:hypothetical protein